ncbi:hypothetical protein [Blastococcus haudaquaticus]|uniref:Lipid droplet-associated protein n=1 Tax=Blastococcus haudaquaticus TaxID=1938745 RepID=A0A286H0D0_9ACTN|nr:hypothetical protein [Blastococcus haudaquaticus]SOE01233.1 hypothetical protein SAMN06272739_3042 [Blastococcus haudaquaticus]
MAREIPEVVRAAAGLAATVLDEARKLPETLPGLPVRVIGIAMQQAMKVQQQYAGLVARGDELLTGIRGENEPGLATFDDEDETPAPSNGYRESAFDRAGDDVGALDETLTDAEVEGLPADPPADTITAVVDELAEQVETGQQPIEELVEEAPEIEEILDEIAIDELVDQAPTLEETAPATPALSLVEDAPATEDADALESALLESDDVPAAVDATAVDAAETADVATTVDVLTPEGEIATVEATVTDEGVAAPEAPEADVPAADDDTVATTDAAAETPEVPAAGGKSKRPAKATKPRKAAKSKGGAADDDAPAPGTGATDTTDAPAAGDTETGTATVTDESGSPVAAATTGADTDGDASTATDEAPGAGEAAGSPTVGSAPIEGYEGFSIAQLRGRLRGYALSTVQDLVSYEESTRSREPYLRLLRNRLEKLERQAVESSPLAPRGA